jgi:hypothetical protein
MIDERKGYFLGDGFLEEKFAQINFSGCVAKISEMKSAPESGRSAGVSMQHLLTLIMNEPQASITP